MLMQSFPEELAQEHARMGGMSVAVPEHAVHSL